MLNLKKCMWSDVSSTVEIADPILKQVIDEISPSKKYPLYVGKYPYGALILEKGVFQVVNNDNRLVPLLHHSIDSKIQDDLNYTGTIPVGMILENSIETFFIFENQTMPSSFYTKGGMISLWSVLEHPNSYQIGSLWNVSSGARTICMLPKITDKSGYEILQRMYNLKQPIPKTLYEHWKIFVHITNYKEFSQPWRSKIIYFSKQWFEHKNDKKWEPFYHALLKKAWTDSTIKRNQFIFDFTFSLAQKNSALKPNPYLVDTLRHLVSIGTGGLPGFKPAIDNVAAPIAGLQKTYIEDYGLKKLPVIMQPHHFSLSSADPVYYSLEMPTTTIFSPRSSNGVSRMVDMRELKHLLSTLFTGILDNNLMAEKTPLFDLAKSVKYDFYHTDHDQHDEIIQINDISESDNNFKKILCNTMVDLKFSKSAPFFRGCVSLSKRA